MTLPSKELLEQISLLIAIVSGLLALLPRLFKRLSFLHRPVVGYGLSAVALCSLGFYLGYLHYERDWMLVDHVQGRSYDFTEQQGARKYWCQWMMDAQNTSALEKNGLRVYETFPWKDFLYEGKGAAKVGFLSAQDSHDSGEPHGRVAVAIYDYDLGRFPKSSTARLTIRASKHTPEIPPKIAVVINEKHVGTIDLNQQSTPYTITFESRPLDHNRNYIYLEPYFDKAPSGDSKLLYLDSVDIATN